jgi:hypothetical protein
MQSTRRDSRFSRNFKFFAIGGLIAVSIYIFSQLSSDNKQPSAEYVTWPLVGETGIVTGDTAACKSAADYDKLAGFGNARDELAFKRFMASKMVTGECALLPAGQEVRVENGSFWGNYCVRAKGAIDCFWTYRSAVRKQ